MSAFSSLALSYLSFHAPFTIPQVFITCFYCANLMIISSDCFLFKFVPFLWLRFGNCAYYSYGWCVVSVFGISLHCLCLSSNTCFVLRYNKPFWCYCVVRVPLWYGPWVWRKMCIILFHAFEQSASFAKSYQKLQRNCQWIEENNFRRFENHLFSTKIFSNDTNNVFSKRPTWFNLTLYIGMLFPTAFFLFCFYAYFTWRWFDAFYYFYYFL